MSSERKKRTRNEPARSQLGGQAAPRDRLPEATAAQLGGVRRWQPWLLWSLAGLALRVLIGMNFGGYWDPGDLDAFVRWGGQVWERGLGSVYNEAPSALAMRRFNRETGEFNLRVRQHSVVCNYPPLSVYLFAASYRLYEAAWTPPDEAGWRRLGISGSVPPEAVRRPVVNTPLCQALFLGWSVVGDFVLAAGCAAIVGLYRSRRAALGTYGLMLVLPPVWWDSIVWGQTETFILAPAAWMLYLMLRERYVSAGVLWGAMLALKTQGILFVPVWGFAVLANAWRRFREHGSEASTRAGFWMPVVGGLVAIATLLLIALPVTIAGGWAWARQCYVANLFETLAQYTTLYAFNIWYLDLLITNSAYATDIVAGLPKRLWGTIVLIAGLGGALAWGLRRWVSEPRGLLAWTALALLLVMMLPTKVHERYLLLAIPWIVLVAVLHARVWPGAALLLIVLMAQLAWPLWLEPGPMVRYPRGRWADVAARTPAEYHAQVREIYDRERAATEPVEWTFTVIGLLGFVLTAGAIVSIPRSSARLAGAGDRLTVRASGPAP